MKTFVFACLASFTLGLSGLAAAANPQVEIKTNMGSITLELFADKSPKTVTNFLRYVKDGFYNGTIFHRVIANFMIQGGGFTPDMKEKLTRGPIENEAGESSLLGLRNTFGTVAMARTNDPNSATAQFFINVKDNPSLDYAGPSRMGYAVFGQVIKGMEVVMKIRNVSTGRVGYFEDVPSSPVIIESATVVAAAPSAGSKAGDKSATEAAQQNSMADGFEFKIEGQSWSTITATGGPCVGVGIAGMRFRVDMVAIPYLRGTLRKEWGFTAFGKSRVYPVDLENTISHTTDWDATVARQQEILNQYRGPSKERDATKEGLDQAQCLARSYMKYVEAQENWMKGNLPLVLKLNPELKPYLKSSKK